MKNLRWLLAAGVALSAAASAQAGLFTDLYQGLNYVRSPISAPPTPTVNGSRVGMIRVVPNNLGQGYRLEFNRNFGTDSFGRPEIYDAGPFELELSGSVAATAEYTTRFFPIGELNFSTTNLNYSLRGKTGAQDVTLSGTLTSTSAVEVNPLGFYTLNLNVQNTNSDLTLDGLAATGSDDTDFDIGPISVKGNIYVDAAVALLASFGVDTTKLEELFPKSPIDRIADNIRSLVADDLTLVAGIQEEAAKSLDGQLSDYSAQFQANSNLVAWLDQQESLTNAPAGGTIPEPHSLALLALGGLAIGLRRRS